MNPAECDAVDYIQFLVAAHSIEQIGAGVVSVEAAPSGQGSTQPLQKPPATPQPICAAVT